MAAMVRISKPPQERRREILSTALELFLKNGYEKTSVGDIVEKIGVAQGLFYYYFRSKEEVYRAAMEQYADDCTACLISIIQDTLPLRDKIDKVFAYMTGLIADSGHALMSAASLAEHIDTDNRFSIHVAQSLIDPISGILEELNEKGLTAIRSPEQAATFLIFGIFGLIHGSPDHNHDPAFFRSDEVIRMIAGVLGLTAEQLLVI